MRHCRAVPFAVLLTALVWTISLRAAEPTYQLTVVTDRPEAIYAVGDKAKFLVTLKKDGQAASEGTVNYVLNKNGMPPTRRGTLKVQAELMVVEGSLAEPGVLRCQVAYAAAGKKPLAATAGAAFDPVVA